MKKLLFSTLALGTLAAVAAPSSVLANENDGKQVQDGDGATRARQESKVELEFGTKTNPPTDIFIGNLVMAYLPDTIDFGIHQANSAGITISNPDETIRKKTQWLVVNDDRPDVEGTGPSKVKSKMQPWAVKAYMTEVVNKSDDTDKIPAVLTFKKQNLQEYQVGNKKTTSGVEDYEHAYPGTEVNGVSNLRNYAKADGSGDVTGAWATDGSFSITGSSTTVQTTVLEKKAAGIDPEHTNKTHNDGKGKGGQGYALSFNEPSLTLSKGQKDNAKYGATLSWLLTSGEDPLGWK